MNQNVTKLIGRLEMFTNGDNVSVQWAKDTESLLDQFDGSDEVLEELQDYLSLYRPEGGDNLYNRQQMDHFCRRIIPILKGRT